MGYRDQALHRVGESDTYLVLPDIYDNIKTQTGLAKTSPGEGKNPIPVGVALARGVVRKFRARVKIGENDVRTRTLLCANDLADSIRAAVGKSVPSNGDVPGGQIVSVSLPRRRVWR